MSFIIIGTSKLGWDIKKVKLKKIQSVINHQLKKNQDIHISPLYGYSLNFLKECKNLNKSKSNFYVKVTFENIENFLHQIFYVFGIIGKSKKIYPQIDEYFDIKKINNLRKALKIIRLSFNIGDVYLTRLANNYKKFLNIKKTKEFNLAIHYSLIENNIDNNFFIQCKKQNKKILSLRSLGGGINNFENNDFYIKKNKRSQRLNIDKYHEKLIKNNITKIEARAYFVLKNKLLNNIVISTSSIKNLKIINKYKNSNISNIKFKIIKECSKIYFRHKKNDNQNINFNKKNYFQNFYKKNNFRIFVKTLFLLKEKKLIGNFYLIKSLIYSLINIKNYTYYKLKIMIISLSLFN